MTNALAIDTTSDYLGLALLKDGRLAANHYKPAGTEMNRTILLVLEGLLAGAGLTLGALDLIVAACGPGSFTGTRIGLAVAKSIAMVQGRPLVGVDTLRLLAAQTKPEPERPFHAALNCVRDEVYHASYRWGPQGLEPLGGMAMTTLAELPNLAGKAPVVLRRFAPEQPGHEQDLARLSPAPLARPHPDGELLLGEGLRIHRACGSGPLPPVEPIYLKPEAFRTWKR